MRGQTPNVFENTAKVLLRIPGLHVVNPVISNAVGDHVRRVRLDEVTELTRRRNNVIIVGDSALNLGKGRTPHGVQGCTSGARTQPKGNVPDPWCKVL